MSYDHGILVCDGGWNCCNGRVTMIGDKGYAYCEPCGLARRSSCSSERVRKLRPHELARLQRREPLARY